MKRDREVRDLAQKLLYDLTQLPGESSDDEKRLGRALVRFLTSPHLAIDALFDDVRRDGVDAMNAKNAQ